MAPPNQGRIIPAIASAAPELTLALANINLDFTLYKAPAPPEFSGLGNALSKRRREAAEDGHEHIVARKLGRLFQNYLPEAPALLKAYGERASQIASSKGSGFAGTSASGIFDDFAGLDGTSLWAAATSSYEALCLHLLACMLARIWSAPQATSIWYEVIEERRKELVSLSSDDPLSLSNIAAARLELTREDLAKWDASARSWLCIADEVMRKEQTRLLLLVDKTKLPVDVSQGVYRSVMGVWKTALTTIEKIITGMSSEVQNGAVLLGLASWHLFPDMHVFVRDTHKMVTQNDPVVPNAGVLTFGIEGHSPDAPEDGVRWALPLAHLRYYGYPVEAKATMGTNSVRLSLRDFHLVVLGSYLARWGNYASDLVSAARLILTMWDFLCFCADPNSAEAVPVADYSSAEWQEYLRRQTPSWNKALRIKDHHVASFPQSNSWFKLLADAADDLVSSEGLNRRAKERLVERGFRRYDSFLAPLPSTAEPMCGLSTLAKLIPVLHEEGVVQVLRAYVKDIDLEPGDVIIRYRHRQQRPELERNRRSDQESRETLATEYVKDANVALPKPKPDDLERLFDDDEQDPEILKRLNTRVFIERTKFVQFEARSLIRDDDDTPMEFVKLFDDDTHDSCVEPALTAGITFGSVAKKRNLNNAEERKTFKRLRRHREQIAFDDKYEYFEYATALEVTAEPSSPSTKSHVRWIPAFAKDKEREEELAQCHETVSSFQLEDVREFGDDGFTWQSEHNDSLEEAFADRRINSLREASYCLLVGDPRIGAVFRRIDSKGVAETDALDIDEVRHAFEGKAADPRRFLKHLCGSDQNVDRNHSRLLTRSLRSVASTASVYKLMPSATITTSVFSEPLYKARWIKDPEHENLTGQHPRSGHQAADESSDDSEYASFNVSELHQGFQNGEVGFEALMAYTLTRPQTFASIAMFENGLLNIDPSGLGEVMALSAANSLYIAMPLLCDPSEKPMEWEIKHVVGNIGQPGISFLVPPPDPKVEKNIGVSWDLVNHAPFDGELSDHFASTSLHASFTKFEVPIGLNPHSGQDVQAFFRQTLIRLHGTNGKWVADLDILGALQDPLFKRYHPGSCRHSNARQTTPQCMLKSIDNWEEFLDRPKVPGVVRATGNWQARLAAAALNVQLGYPILVLPKTQDSHTGPMSTEKPQFCWACAFADFETAKIQQRRRVIDNTFKAEDIPFVIA